MNKKGIAWNTLVIIGIGIIFIILALIFVKGMFGELYLEPNEKAIGDICKDIGGEPNLYKTNWSNICGFEVYRGTCVENGYVLDSKGYLLVDGKVFTFTEVENLFKDDWRQWQNDSCNLFMEER